MSPLTAPSKPAWTGFRPDPAAFEPASPEVTGPLLDALRRPGRLLKRVPAGTQLTGYYRFYPDSPESPDSPLFLKVLPEERLTSQLDADRIARWLGEQEIAVNPLCAGFPRELPAGLALLAYPLIEGRFPKPTESDLARIGRALGRLHVALANFPESGAISHIDIHNASQKRDGQLAALHARILAGDLSPAQQPDSLRRLLADTDTRLPTTDRQVIHGDPNPGNILLPEHDDPVFLDFEDCRHSRQSPAVDLAMALERLVMVRTPDAHKAECLARCFLDSYRSQARVPEAVDFSSVLRTLAVRALILLTLADSEGAAPDADEWDKFHFLYAETQRRHDLLSRLGDYLIG